MFLRYKKRGPHNSSLLWGHKWGSCAVRLKVSAKQPSVANWRELPSKQPSEIISPAVWCMQNMRYLMAETPKAVVSKIRRKPTIVSNSYTLFWPLRSIDTHLPHWIEQELNIYIYIYIYIYQRKGRYWNDETNTTISRIAEGNPQKIYQRVYHVITSTLHARISLAQTSRLTKPLGAKYTRRIIILSFKPPTDDIFSYEIDRRNIIINNIIYSCI